MLLSINCYSIYKRIRIPFPVFYSPAALSFSLFPPSGYFILLSNAHSFAAVLSYILIYSAFIFPLFREQANSKHAFLSHHPFPLPPRPCGIFTYTQEEAASSTSPAVATATACATGPATNTSKVTAAADGSVLKASTYNAISISGGTAGNAEVRATRLFDSSAQRYTEIKC